MSIKKIALCSLLTATIITNDSHCISINFDEINKLKERYYSILKLEENKEEKKTLLEDLLLEVKDLKPSFLEIFSDSFCIGLSLGATNTLIKNLYAKPSTTLVLATIIGSGLTDIA